MEKYTTFRVVRSATGRCQRYRGLMLAILIMACSQLLAAEVLIELNRFLDATHTFSAEFEQVTLDEDGRSGRPMSGRFLLSKPGRFRWDYLQPYQQQIVSNGEKIWFYDADLEQVTVKPLGNTIGSTPALLLTGQVDLDHDFLVDAQGGNGNVRWVRLVPRSQDSSFRHIKLELNKDRLRGMELADSFGQVTRITFYNSRINVPIEASIFEFVAPDGADILEDL